MAKQLQFNFNGFNEGLFDKVKQAYTLQEETRLRKELEHLKHVVAGFKGYRTKRKKNQH